MLMITKGSSFPPTATEDVPQEGQKRPGLLPSFFFFFFFFSMQDTLFTLTSPHHFPSLVREYEMWGGLVEVKGTLNVNWVKRRLV